VPDPLTGPLPAQSLDVLRRSSALWLLLPGGPRIAWYVWKDGAAYVVHGGIEQELPGLAELSEVEDAEVEITAVNKGVVVTLPAAVEAVRPADEGWAAAIAALHAHRQNPPDGAAQPQRWAEQSQVTRLVPRA
jgi:hypothetical protein